MTVLFVRITPDIVIECLWARITLLEQLLKNILVEI